MLAGPRLRRHRRKRKLRLWDYMVHQVTAFTKPGIRYLLDDEFLDTLAAGSVDATLATPGPGGKRTVRADTGTNLSIGSGIMKWDAAAGAWDPWLWYDDLAFVRTAGRMLFSHVNYTTGKHQFGWCASTHSAGRHLAHYIGDGSVIFGANTSVKIQAILPATTDLYSGIVQRASGGYFFVKQGTGNWKLEYISNLDSTTPLYVFTGAVLVGSDVDTYNFRVPARLWLPTPLAYDTFTRANGALGTSETTGPDSQTVTARTWNNRVGTTQIATNKASASALVGGLAIATVDTGTVNVVMQGTLTRAGGETGIVLRYADADNYIRAEHDGTNMKLIKRVATAETDVISAVVALGAGVVAVTAEGTSFVLHLNNAKVGATSTISDAGLQTGTEQGLFSTNTGNTQDAFLVMPRGTGGEYDGALNRYSGARP